MVIPGYVSQFTVTFETQASITSRATRYCGMGHHMMVGTFTVE